MAGTYKHYDCRAGDVYIKGTMSGQMTIAADNFIYVTGDLTYKDKAIDVLGLVGNNAVFVYNPVRITGFSGSGSTLAELGTGAPNAFTPRRPTARSTPPSCRSGTPSRCRTTAAATAAT